MAGGRASWAPPSFSAPEAGGTRAARDGSAPFAEEGPQQLARFRLADPGIDFRRVVAGRLGEQAGAVEDGAALWVRGGEMEAAEAGERDRPGAHRAGLERHPPGAFVEPRGAQRRRGRAP